MYLPDRRGGERPLVELEQAEALRVALSYFRDDLVIVQWDAAFVYDRLRRRPMVLPVVVEV